MKFVIKAFLTLGVLLTVTACGASEEGSQKNSDDEEQAKHSELIVGSTTGPFEDMLKDSIVPILEEKGYDVRVETFGDYVQPNLALTNGELDANLFQNQSFLDNYNDENNDDLIGLFPVPTPPMGIYSNEYRSTEEIKDGAVVSLPNDPVNMGRALIVMQNAGWIEVTEEFVPTQATVDDITNNPHQIELIPIEAAQTPRSLQDVDYSVITGNFALDAGLEFSEALLLEDMALEFMNYLTVQNKDQDEQFVEDFQAAFESEAFQIYKDSELQGFSTPPYMDDNTELNNY